MALLALAAGLGVVSSVLGYGESKKATSRAKSAAELESKRAAIQNVKNRRAALASIRRQQAQQQAVAISNGMGGGSGAHGTKSSVQAQGLASVADQAQSIEMGAGVNELLASSNAHRARAGTYSAVAGLASQVYSFGAAKAQAKAETPSLPEGL